MEIFKELISDLIDENISLSNIMRKAKIFASINKIPEMQKWIKYELEGYKNKDELPSYRILGVGNMGHFQGPFGSSMKNVVLPTINLPEPLLDFANHCYVYQSVSEIEGMVSSEENGLMRKWPAEYIALAQNYITASGGMVLVDAHQPISKSLLIGIIDNVKNKLLDFLLDVDQNNLVIEGVEMNDEKRDAIRQKFEINVYGDNNSIASGSNFTQSVSNVVKNDLDSLCRFLRDNKVSEEDIVKLEEAINHDKEVDKTKNAFGQKVIAWIGNMITKAANGSWDVAMQVAPVLITSALNKYYGL